MSDHERPHERLIRQLEDGDEPAPDVWVPPAERPGLDNLAVLDDVGDLTEFADEVLAFERHWWKYAGVKESEIRERWGISSTRYYQLLNALIDTDAALVADPLLVRRLRRLRAARQRQRSTRRRLEDGAE